MKKTGIFIQARTDSKRLNGKIYKPLLTPRCQGYSNQSILEHIYRRLSKINENKYITAVLAPEEDSQLIDWCQNLGITVFCGPADDVRERYRQAALYFGVDTVVRATGDNPCVDPEIAQKTIVELHKSQADLFSFGNLPIGMAVEAMKVEALLKDSVSEFHVTQKYTEECREHVSVHIKQQKDIFTCLHPNYSPLENLIKNCSLKRNQVEENLLKNFSNIRLTVDTPKDLEVVRSVFACLGLVFGLYEIIQLYRRYPDLFTANAYVKQNVIHALAL